MALQGALKIIAAIQDDNYLQKITNNIAHLENVNMVASSKYTTDIIELCEKLSPDVLISDLSLENGEMANAIKDVCRKTKNDIAVIATASNKEGETRITQSFQNGAKLFMKDLDNPDILYNTLHMIHHKHELPGSHAVPKPPSRQELMKIISELLHKLKLPAHFAGYHYLKSAILHVTLRTEKLPDISTRLYLKIAEEFETNMRHVERALIRAAAYITNSNGKEFVLRTILGYDVDAANYTLNVKELIALISDQLRVKYFLD